MIPNITGGNETVNYCDYFAYGEGYLFSQANLGIGLVILSDRYNGTLDN
jgi:hypothetical protein